MSGLDVKDCTHRFGEVTVFHALSLSVPRGGFTVLVGPSGCGKSTLFNVLTGVTPRSRGDINWLDRRVSDLVNTAAYMQQKDLLLPWMSLLENALLPARIAGRDRLESRRAADALFQRLNLAGAEDLTPKHASGGMRQRCALVRTLMFERELVLLDEPLSALDAITRAGLQDLLLMLQRDFSRTILMITHDVEEALLLADEVLVCSPMPMRIRERIIPPGPKPRSLENPALMATRSRIVRRLQQEMNDVAK